MAEQDLPELLDPMIGQKIGRYVIRRRLAEGGMGAVYLASHERLENTWKVIKVLLPTYARHAMLRDRFEREALAVSRLRHKNIITIDDYGQLPDGQLFLMMPFLVGRPLDEYLRDHGKLSEHLALHILAQVCGALQHMHDAGIVHRDIKPSNIFILGDSDDDETCRVMLIDLGIAKSLGEREGVTDTGSQMGTPAYMAVEQFENAAGVTPLADLYAVAIVAWEMITGRLPWGMHSSHVLYKKQKEEPLVCPPELSAAWFAVLSAALSVHLVDRPTSVRALTGALASTVPAIPPHLPSGADIVAKQAQSFIQHAPPSAETVRNASNQQSSSPILWPPRETRSPLPSSPPGQLPPLAVHTISNQTPLHTPPLNQRPAAAIAASPTTLSALSGAGGASTSPRTSYVRVVLATLGVAVLATLVTFSLARRGPAEPQPGPPTSQATELPSPILADAAVPIDAAAPIDATAPIDAVAALGATSSVAGAGAAPTDAATIDASVLGSRPPSNRHGSSGAAKAREVPQATTPSPKDVGPGSRRGSGGRFNPNAVGGEE